MRLAAQPELPADAVDLASSTVERLRRGIESGRTRPREWRLGQLERMKAMLLENRSAPLEALHASSGGVCPNGAIWQVASPSLPFGGVWPSGLGTHHGRAGFETFSHHTSVVRKRPGSTRGWSTRPTGSSRSGSSRR